MDGAVSVKIVLVALCPPRKCCQHAHILDAFASGFIFHCFKHYSLCITLELKYNLLMLLPVILI